MPEKEELSLAVGSELEVVQTCDSQAEVTGAAKAGEELSEDDLEAVAGGATVYVNRGGGVAGGR